MGPLTTLQMGLIVIDRVALADVATIRKSLEGLAVAVTVLVPTGGSILPVSGRYYPGAGGDCTRRALCQVAASDFDALIIPDGVTTDDLLAAPQVIRFLHEVAAKGIPVVSVGYLSHLLDRDTTLTGLCTPRQGVASASRG